MANERSDAVNLNHRCMVAQKGHTCKLKMLLQTKNFTCKLKMLLQIKK